MILHLFVIIEVGLGFKNPVFIRANGGGRTNLFSLLGRRMLLWCRHDFVLACDFPSVLSVQAGKTAVMLAIEKGLEGCLKLLIAARPDLNQQDNVSLFECGCLHT